MNVILVMAMTADGKTTLWNNPNGHGWSSPEDQKNFRALTRSHKIVVMGSSTYAAVKAHIRLSPGTKRIVMTSRPEDFSKDRVEGQLEFTGETPKALISRLGNEGHTSALLVGGSQINAAFLKQNLIDECILTIEPRFTGTGNSLFAPVNADVPLKLVKVTKLNKQGTLLVRYKPDYEHPSA